MYSWKLTIQTTVYGTDSGSGCAKVNSQKIAKRRENNLDMRGQYPIMEANL
jgi:hypothetical protein